MTTPAAPPRQYVVRKPHGDPDSARALAHGYDELADAVAAELHRATLVIDGLGDSWTGRGADGRRTPSEVLAEDAARVTRALRRSADDLRHYAHRLAKAHEHHGWSLGKLVALGAMVTVGAAAVVVTIGAAAPAEAAAATAAVEAAETAAAAAGAASSSVAADLAAWQSLLSGIRPLAPFVLPHVVSAGSSAGLDAASQLLTTHRLDGHSLAVSAVAGFAGSSTGELVEQHLLATPSLVRRAAEAGTWSASGAAASYADAGSVSPVDVLSLGLTGLVARDVRYGVDEARLMWKLRVPQLPLGFDSNRDWRRFVTTLYDGFQATGRGDAVVAFRGSSITGVSWRHGHPFDSLYRSDWDLAVVHPGLLRRAAELGVPLRGGGRRSAVVHLETLRRLGLGDLAQQLNELADRPVSWMFYGDVQAVVDRGAHLVVPKP